MGNIFEKPSDENAKIADSSGLSKEDQVRLGNIYQQIFMSKAGQKSVNLESFQAIFGRVEGNLISKSLLSYFSTSITDFRSFQQFVIDCTRSSSNKTLGVFFNMIPTDEDTTPRKHFQSFLKLIIDTAYFNESLSNDLLESTTLQTCDLIFSSTSMRHIEADMKGKLDILTVCGVINNYLPCAAQVFETFITRIVFDITELLAFKPFQHPLFEGESEIIAHTGLLMTLSLHCSKLQGKWKKLYSTSTDGLSFNRVVHHILGYDGPTLILVKCIGGEGNILGAFATDRWKEQNQFYGSSNNFLFSLSPRLRLFRTKSPNNGNFQWLNTKAFSLPHGLGLGGNTEGFRFFIPESLENCTASNFCPTYETGRLLGKSDKVGKDSDSFISQQDERFEIDILEIWGCGGDEIVESALLAQEEERENVAENIRKAQKVDKAAFFNNEFDQEMFLSKTFGHRSKTSNRSGGA